MDSTGRLNFITPKISIFNIFHFEYIFMTSLQAAFSVYFKSTLNPIKECFLFFIKHIQTKSRMRKMFDGKYIRRQK